MVIIRLQIKFMRLLKNTIKNNTKISSNRSFGLVFFFVFLLIGLYPLIIYNNEPRLWSVIISLIFLLLGLLNSTILTPLNIIWFKFGILLGNIVSPIIMAIIFFLVVYPTGIIVKIFTKNFLGLKFDKNLKTYWIKKTELNSTMKDQF